MAKDPVCGMTVDENTPVATVVYENNTYYFCSNQCVEKFKENPKRYMEKEEKES